jgi:hypothetical protein
MSVRLVVVWPVSFHVWANREGPVARRRALRLTFRGLKEFGGREPARTPGSSRTTVCELLQSASLVSRCRLHSSHCRPDHRAYRVWLFASQAGCLRGSIPGTAEMSCCSAMAGGCSHNRTAAHTNLLCGESCVVACVAEFIRGSRRDSCGNRRPGATIAALAFRPCGCGGGA